MIRDGRPLEEVVPAIDALALELVPFTNSGAIDVAELWQQGQRYGLSLGDRACLALAAHSGVPVLTADRVWADLEIGVEVVLIR